jgi:hypothetical protein
MGIFSAILLLIIVYIIFAVIIFPLLVMTIFAFGALGALFPYIVGAVALYLLWKIVKKRA